MRAEGPPPAGGTDLAALLRDLRPRLSGTEFAFGVLRDGQVMPPGLAPLGTFREGEGLTVIAPAERFAGGGVEHAAGWALISLEVRSSLAAVGLTAAVAQALAEAGISANVVAAFHHDHLFVPWARREEALRVLDRLSARGAP